METTVQDEAAIISQLKYWKNRANLTTKDLAAKAGVSRTGLSQILNGHKSPTLATLVKLCGVMGCRIYLTV